MLNLRDPTNFSSPPPHASQWASNPSDHFASDVISAVEEGRELPLSVVLAMEEVPQFSKAFGTKMSMARSNGKNISFYPRRVEPLRSMSLTSTGEGSKIELGTVGEEEEGRGRREEGV
jgi:hypothetical protein